MGNLAIRAVGLGKKYWRGVNDTGALIDRFRRKRNLDPFWALRNVSIEIPSGALVGIIGLNGSGKTTLLKILSRITRPNEGLAEIYGRVGSLLTVGTGFHRELTGRENIYLNGALLGMSKAEINRKFDDIIEFSGVVEALDTPIKRYSSGMLVRLGFAIAAHLEQDIMLVDEVLAVGDAGFQRKCLAKISDVARRGQTVLLVSHEMPAITEVCDRAIWLDNGLIRACGKTSEIVDRYLAWIARERVSHHGFISLDGRTDITGDGAIQLRHIRLLNKDNNPVPCFRSGQGAKIALGYKSFGSAGLFNLTVGLTIHNSRRLPVTICESPLEGSSFGNLPPTGEITCEFDRLPLMPGQYSIDVTCRHGQRIVAKICGAGDFSVIQGNFYPDRPLPPPGSGDVLLDHRWSLCEVREDQGS